MIAFTDGLLDAINDRIAAHPPERGGALLGLPNSNVACRLIDDPGAQTTSSSYYPSRKLQEEVNEEEKRTGLVFKGIVHSHPSGIESPSRLDLLAFRLGLDQNPHLPSFLCPIVTWPASGNGKQHELLLPNGRSLFCYTATRAVPRLQRPVGTRAADSGRAEHATSPGVVVLGCKAVAMPLLKHLEVMRLALAAVGYKTNQTIDGRVELNGTLFLTSTIQLEQFELIILFAPTYPFSSPTLLYTDYRVAGADTTSVPIVWSGPTAMLPDGTPSWVAGAVKWLQDHRCAKPICEMSPTGGSEDGRG